MGELAKIAIQIISDSLPDSDIAKLVALVIFCTFLLMLFGRIKLEWIAYALRHIYRWLRCKIFRKHRYRLQGIGSTNLATGSVRGTFICAICGHLRIVR